MIKKHLFPFVSICFCFVVLVGCETNDVSTRDDLPKLYNTVDWQNPSFVNSNNPYDYLGALHNQGLEYINNRMGMSAYIDTLYPSSDTLAIHFVDSVLGYSLHPDTLAKHLRTARFSATRLDSLIESTFLSPLAQSYIYKMAIILGAGTGSLLSLEDQLSGMIALEDSALANLSGNDKLVVLLGGAIGRYSVAYWRSDDSLTWPAFEYHQRAIIYSPVAKFHSPRPQYPNPWAAYMWFKKNRWAYQDLIGVAGGAILGAGAGANPASVLLAALGGAILQSGGAI